MSEIKRMILELLIVAGMAVGIGLAANALNPDGLSLKRNYFPPPSTKNGHGSNAPSSTRPTAASTAASGNEVAQSHPIGTTSGAAATTDHSHVRAALEAFGLKAIEHDEVATLYRDPWYAQGLFVFVDARDDKEYAEGHIPGAYHLYYYYKDRYIDAVLPALRGADKIIVYCNGGDCEDSKQTADMLRAEYAIDPDKIFVYVEGMDGWRSRRMPLEKGVRGSGEIAEGQP